MPGHWMSRGGVGVGVGRQNRTGRVMYTLYIGDMHGCSASHQPLGPVGVGVGGVGDVVGLGGGGRWGCGGVRGCGGG